MMADGIDAIRKKSSTTLTGTRSKMFCAHLSLSKILDFVGSRGPKCKVSSENTECRISALDPPPWKLVDWDTFQPAPPPGTQIPQKPGSQEAYVLLFLTTELCVTHKILGVRQTNSNMKSRMLSPDLKGRCGRVLGLLSRFLLQLHAVIDGSFWSYLDLRCVILDQSTGCFSIILSVDEWIYWKQKIKLRCEFPQQIGL